MYSIQNVVVTVLLSSTSVLASPLQEDGTLKRDVDSSSATSSPCAQVSQLAASATSKNKDAFPTISAKLAYDCLQSVPLGYTSNNVEWLESLRPYINWQTTTAYLKDPPHGYLEPAWDVYGNLDKLISKAKQRDFENEYDLGFQIYRLFQRAHDGHFRYTPDIVGGIFNFFRTIPLVSVSEDGKSAPQVYTHADVVLSQVPGSSFTPSAITEIDGEAATTYLENWAQYGSLQDPDALYNNVFYELAQVALGKYGTGTGTFAGGGRGAYIYPGPTTTLTFANGTSRTFENYARVVTSFKGISSGRDLYKHFHNRINSDGILVPHKLPRHGYPNDPYTIERDHQIAGYFNFSSPKYNDAAVLSIPDMVLGIGSFPGNERKFQSVSYQFLREAQRLGKKKLIIDLSANGGGTIMQGYNLFAELFPLLDPYGGTRFRAHEAFNIIGEEVSKVAPKPYPWDFNDFKKYGKYDYYAGVPFDYMADMTSGGEAFTSWAEKYGPHTHHGDEFTSIIRWNLSDPAIKFDNGIAVTGYASRKNKPVARPHFFAPENIIILYDGYCASTCTIFSQLMTEQAGIKTIALGGRSTKKGLIQAVGGVKGTNDYPWPTIRGLVQHLYKIVPSKRARQLMKNPVLAAYKSEYPLRRGLNNYAVNARDGIPKYGDKEQVPLQFIHQSADCRVFYTKEMISDVTSIWRAAYESVWGGENRCVAGDVMVGGEERRGLNGDGNENEDVGVNEKKGEEEPLRNWSKEEIEHALNGSPDYWSDVISARGEGMAF